MLQQELDFIPILTTQRMNSAESQHHHDVNIDAFSNQCKLVYSLLCEGKSLTTTDALEHGIGDLRARIRDLIRAKVPIRKEWVTKDGKVTRYKKYSLIK